MPSPVYFTSPEGTVYRVWDTVRRGAKRFYANPPAPWATTRVFHASDGRERFVSLVCLLELHPEWSSAPTDDMLAILFARSERGRGWKSLSLAERASQLGGRIGHE